MEKMRTEIFNFEIAHQDSVTLLRCVATLDLPPEEALQAFLKKDFHSEYCRFMKNGSAVYRDKALEKHYLAYVADHA